MMIQLPKAQFAGYFKFEAVRIDADGEEHRRTLADWFPNLITNAGLELAGTSPITSLSAWCKVGTGTNAPTVLDTQLQTYVASTNSLQSSSTVATTSPPYYTTITRTYRFGAGVAQGNISEVGMASLSGANNGTMWSRALILDGAGNPTTITVLSDEYLDVTYQIRNYMDDVGDTPYSINISGVTYTGVVRRANVTSALSLNSPAGGDNGTNAITVYNGGISAVTAQPTGNSLSKSVNNYAYVAGSLQRDFYGVFGLNDANLVGGITALMIRTTYGYFQFSVSPAIPKTSDKTMTLNFRCGPWGRYTPP